MPELAEVEYYRRIWIAGLGERIESLVSRPECRVFRGTDPGALQRSLAGAPLTSSRSHGKQLLFGFGPAGWLGIHLGMTGRLRIDGPDAAPGKHDHLVLRQSNRSLVFEDPRMFGRVRFDADQGGELPSWWASLPPEILSRGFGATRMEHILTRHPGTSLKALLLDQTCFPGIGNWMADEILWRARIHPETRPRQLLATAPSLLRATVREVARDALRVIAPDWGDPPDSWLFNHRWRDGGICPRARCGSSLRRAAVRGRTSCWCPECQIPSR